MPALRFLPVVEELLAGGLSAHFVATGQSMAPTIADGDAVVVTPAGGTRLEAGMIVLAKVDGRFLAHRIVGFSHEGTLVLRGDGRAHDDPPVARDAVRGVITRVIRAPRVSVLGGVWQWTRSLLRRGYRCVFPG